MTLADFWDSLFSEYSLQVSRVIYHSLASVAIIVAGIWAAYKIGSYRMLKPTLDLSLKIQTQRVSSDEVYFLVVLTMKNTSKMKVDYGHSASFLHRLREMSEHELEKLRTAATKSDSGGAMAWPYLDGAHSCREKNIEKGKAIVEPGATEGQFYEFIVSVRDGEYVLVKCVVYDRKQGKIVWPIQTIYKVGGNSNG